MVDVSFLQYTLKTILIQSEITIWVVWKLSLLVFLKKKFTKNIYSMWKNNLRVWKLSLFFSIFIFISSKIFLHSLLLNSDGPFTGQDWIILNIFYQYDSNCVCVFFHWDSLHARLNSHYEAWSYKKKNTKKITGYRKSV